MAVAPDGTLLVAERGNDRVLALPDRDGDGVADDTVVVGSGYDDAHSLAFAADGTLYVAGNGTLFAVELGPDLRERSRRAILDLPAGGVHTTRTVAALPDGRHLISVGSSCNVCWEEDPRRATILIADADGSNSRVFMRGLRNAVGVAVDPATGIPGRPSTAATCWATTYRRRPYTGSKMGRTPGGHAAMRHDRGPRLRRGGGADDGPDGLRPGRMPAATFQAHMAPLGIAFWDDTPTSPSMAPGTARRRSATRSGVCRGPPKDQPAELEPFLTGFLDDASGDASGRPAGLIVGSDGALYVSDDKAGAIYQVTRSP